jgi:hypothetical protein
MKRLLCAIATLLLAACATDQPQGDALETTLDSYESTLTCGGDLTQAVGFLDPEWLATNPDQSDPGARARAPAPGDRHRLPRR